MFSLRFCVGLLCPLLLIACTPQPELLGISKQQWTKYDKQQQQQILQRYHEFKSHPNQSSFKIDRSSVITVTLSDGKALMPPFSKSHGFIPVTFKLANGQCTAISLNHPNSSDQVKLFACYKENVLLLDPSHFATDYKAGSVRLYATPLWDSGMTYSNVSSAGYAHLQGVTVKVMRKNLPQESKK